MGFLIVNRRNTFLTIQLTGSQIYVAARNTVGPFADTEKSADLKQKETLGDIFVEPVTAEKVMAWSPKKSHKPQDDKIETSEG